MGVTFTSKFKEAWDAITINDETLPRRMRSVREIAFDELRRKVEAEEEDFVRSITESLYAGDAYLLRGAYPKAFMEEIKEKAHAYCQQSSSSFHKMLEGCPDFHRKIDEELAKKYSFTMVKHACYFYPWNDDPLHLFTPVWERWGVVKLLSGQRFDEFTRNTPKDGVIDRIQIVRYSPGVGTLALHSDPYLHQRLIISGYMSKKGVDFETGGFYIIGADGKPVDMEDQIEVGDMLVAYATVQHGVAVVDSHKPADWSSTAGRWFLSMYTNASDEVKDRHTGYAIKP